MTILFTSDWHCSVINLDRCQRLVDQILSLSNKDTYIVLCGDIKHHLNPVDVRVINFLVHSITEIREHSAGFLFVRGNHDSITTQDGVPSCVPLIEALEADYIADKNWTVAEIFQADTSDRRDVLRARIWMVPYFREATRQKKAFQDALRHARPKKKDVADILAFHNEVAGCEVSPYRKGQGLTLEDIGAKHYDVCVSGHIHKAQFIKPNLHYVGSPFPMDWGEVNFQHRLLRIEI